MKNEVEIRRAFEYLRPYLNYESTADETEIFHTLETLAAAVELATKVEAAASLDRFFAPAKGGSTRFRYGERR